MGYPEVAIIILNWNGYRDTIECINSLKKISYPNYRIVVVDNDSKDNSVMLISSRFPEITILKNKINSGYTGGNNLGIQFALSSTAEYIMLLNNDTIVTSNFLSKLIETINIDDTIGAISPTILYSNNKSIINSSGIKINLFSTYPFIDPLFNQTKKDLGKELIIRDALIGCCILIKRQVIELVGLLDERYFLYIEDMDYSYRINQKGYKLVVNPLSEIYHKVSSSTGGVGSLLNSYYINRNLFLYLSENVNIVNKNTVWLYYIKGRIFEMIDKAKKWKFSNVYATLLGIFHGIIRRYGFNRLS